MRQHFFGEDGLTRLAQNFCQLPICRRNNFQHHLVGLDINQHLVSCDLLAHLDMPGGNLTICDGLWKFRCFDFYHDMVLRLRLL